MPVITPRRQRYPVSSTQSMAIAMMLVLFIATLVRSQAVFRNLSAIRINRLALSPATAVGRWNAETIPAASLPRSTALYSLEQNDPSQTSTLLEMLKTNPNHPLVRFALGQRYYQAGDIDRALQYWRSVPDVDVYFAMRSTLAISMQDEPTAVAYADLSRQIQPQDSYSRLPMLRDLCRWFYERKDYPAALPWCRSYAALEASPATQLLLANALTGASNLSEALDLLRMLIEGNQTQVSGQAYFLLGEIQRRQGDYQAALSAYEQSLETGYAHLWVLISLANTYRQLGDMPKACEVYAAALQSGYTADTQNQSNFLDCGK